MSTIEISAKNDALIAMICKKLNYKKRTVYLVQGPTPKNKELRSYWDGGSRDYYSVYEIATGRIETMGSNHPFFERDKPSTLKELPPGFLLIETGVFCGKPSMMRIYSNEADRIKLLGNK